jgi:hypothetical protein
VLLLRGVPHLQGVIFGVGRYKIARGPVHPGDGSDWEVLLVEHVDFCATLRVPERDKGGVSHEQIDGGESVPLQVHHLDSSVFHLKRKLLIRFLVNFIFFVANFE